MKPGSAKHHVDHESVRLSTTVTKPIKCPHTNKMQITLIYRIHLYRSTAPLTHGLYRQPIMNYQIFKHRLCKPSISTALILSIQLGSTTVHVAQNLNIACVALWLRVASIHICGRDLGTRSLFYAYIRMYVFRNMCTIEAY